MDFPTLRKRKLTLQLCIGMSTFHQQRSKMDTHTQQPRENEIPPQPSANQNSHHPSSQSHTSSTQRSHHPCVNLKPSRRHPDHSISMLRKIAGAAPPIFFLIWFAYLVLRSWPTTSATASRYPSNFWSASRSRLQLSFPCG